MEDENALEFLNDEELLKSIDDIFKDTEKQLDELIQRTDKQLKDFLEKEYRARREQEKSPFFFMCKMRCYKVPTKKALKSL